MTDDYYQPPPLKSIEVELNVTREQFDKFHEAMKNHVLLMVMRVEVPMGEHYREDDCSVTLKSIGTTERLK